MDSGFFIEKTQISGPIIKNKFYLDLEFADEFVFSANNKAL
jgi:hypothetical protein